MKWLKAFMAGIAVPTILLPIILFFASNFEKTELLHITFIHFIPLIWGLWNMFYFAILKHILPGNQHSRLLITGAILGLIVSTYAVFGLNLSSSLNLPISMTYLPMILGPIVYALIWRYLVKDLNLILALDD